MESMNSGRGDMVLKVLVVNWFILCDLKVADHWQQLMLKMEDRLKLVNASVAFYKTSEQVRLKLTQRSSLI